MKRKSARCSTGHGTGVLMPADLRQMLERGPLPRLRTGAQASARDRGQKRERRRKDRMSAGRKMRRPSMWRAFRERLRETKATIRPVATLLAWVTQKWRRGKAREAAS